MTAKAGTKSLTTALVWIPEEAFWEPIQAIRRQWDRHLPVWPMPHVTLLYPFRPKEELSVAEPHVRKAVERVAPFEVTLRLFSSFPHRMPTMFLVPEPADGLRALHSSLTLEFPDCNDLDRFANGFTPHLSVGQCAAPENLDGVLGRLQAAFPPLSLRVGEVTLLRRGPDTDDLMTEVARFRLIG